VSEVIDPDATAGSGSSTPRKRAAAAASGRLCLVVVGEGLDATYPLPDRGPVAIGRAPDSDIHIDHASVSRNHAVLRVGDPLVIEDLGSANGTRIRDRWLDSHTTAEVGLGEPIDVGSVMVVIQARSAAPRKQRHIWAHGYFEARLDEECARAQRSGGTFAVLRLHCRAETGRAVEDCLCRELRAMDVIGYYGPREHEALVVDVRPENVPAVVNKLTAALAAANAEASIGVACYPTDARNPYELLSRASAAALGQRATAPGTSPLVIPNAAIQNLDRIVHRIAGGSISVLITGETGVGKEVLAERIQKLSRRADKPFLRLNCAALSESLLESELFGHEKGAFTGAVLAKTGLLESADGGTVFLDELGEMPQSTQVKLLRVLEERQVLKVGAVKPIKIDVRFVAATNRDLEAEIVRGTFRQDLYFRLNGVTLVIPPLRERTSEIFDLVHGFLRIAAERDGLPPPPGIAPDALALLRGHSWPGNIRELRNVVERALLLSGGGMIELEHLPSEKMRRREEPAAAPAAPPPPPPPPPPPLQPPPEVRSPDAKLRRGEALTKEDLLDALQRAGGNQTEAARLLQVSRRTFINRVEHFQLPRPRKK
jgi:two-component system response regulator AtoC